MSFNNPAHQIFRQSVVGAEGMYAKMWDPPNESPDTPDLLNPTNPVPEVMAAAGFQGTPTLLHTVQRELCNKIDILTWDGAKNLRFYTFTDRDNDATSSGNFPGANIRVPRGVIFHCDTAFFATLFDPAIPVGHCRDGKRRAAANLSKVLLPNNSIVDLSATFPGFNSNLLTAADPWTGDPNLLFDTDPHAMTVPYDVEVLWVPDDRDSNWSDLAPGARATYPKHGDIPGVNDNFHGNAGGGVGADDFFAFHDFNADYFFVTGVPVPAARVDRGGTGVGDIPPGIVVPAGLNSGVAGQQVSINAEVGETIYLRCLDAAYDCIDVTFPVDVILIAWDGRALGVPPHGQYNSAILVPANTNIHLSTARRFDVLIKVDTAIDSLATVVFTGPREKANEPVAGFENRVNITARIPITIAYSLSGRVADSQGNPLAGVTMHLTGNADKTAVTDLEGSYKIMGLFDGSYTVTPTLDGFEFAPLSRNISISGASVTGHDFEVTQTAGLFVITGSVVTSRNALPIPGVQMTLEGPGNGTAVTGAAGNYIFSGLPDGRYTITPSLAGIAFSPPGRRVRIRGVNQAARLFRGRGVA